MRAPAACRAGATVGQVLEAGRAVYAGAGLAEGRARVRRPRHRHRDGRGAVARPGDADAELVEGMVLCVEPGVSVAGVGGALIEHELIVGIREPRLLCVTPSLT